MASITAVMLVGSEDSYHGGICPTHELALWENDHPVWQLRKVGEAKPSASWIPTVDHMLEDGIVMACLLGLHIPSVHAEALNFTADFKNRADLLEDISALDLASTYAACREVAPNHKIVLTVLRESHLLQQLHMLRDYKLSVEVCVTLYARQHSGFTGECQQFGELPPG
jgi:hypothetical protein